MCFLRGFYSVSVSRGFSAAVRASASGGVASCRRRLRSSARPPTAKAAVSSTAVSPYQKSAVCSIFSPFLFICKAAEKPKKKHSAACPGISLRLGGNFAGSKNRRILTISYRQRDAPVVFLRFCSFGLARRFLFRGCCAKHSSPDPHATICDRSLPLRNARSYSHRRFSLSYGSVPATQRSPLRHRQAQDRSGLWHSILQANSA